MWRRSPGGGGASRGITPAGACFDMEKSGTTSFGVRVKTFSAHVVYFPDLG